MVTSLFGPNGTPAAKKNLVTGLKNGMNRGSVGTPAPLPSGLFICVLHVRRFAGVTALFLRTSEIDIRLLLRSIEHAGGGDLADATHGLVRLSPVSGWRVIVSPRGASSTCRLPGRPARRRAAADCGSMHLFPIRR